MRSGGGRWVAVAAAVIAACGCGASAPASSSTTRLKTVFLVVFENKNWAQIAQNPEAPYINGALLSAGALAQQYYNPPMLHPSEPNYIWMEAGDSLGIKDDNGPDVNSVDTTDHLVTYLERAGLPWKAYLEDIIGDTCPLDNVARYAAKHNPFVFFKDLTENGNRQSQRCIQHLRPLSELASDLQANVVARYNFILPNLCHSTHDCGVSSGDDWLRQTIPMLTASSAFEDGGLVFVVWEEGEGGTDGPIGMIALSPRAKRGFSNTVHYDHSSLLKTLQEILAVRPLLRHAGDPTTNDLSDLFTTFP